MTFFSIPFFILLFITYFFVFIVDDHDKRLWILLISSYFFYAYWDVRFLALMIAEEYLCYYLAIQIEKKRRRGLLIFGVVVSVSILAFFKYMGFFIDNISLVLGREIPIHWRVVLPIGISFYIFQSLSYLVDVWRGTIRAKHSFRDVSLYISFFPQLVAGPIVRAKDFLPQLDKRILLTRDNFDLGIRFFIWGMFKKIVVADRLAVCVDSVYGAPYVYSGLSVLIATLSYYLQIFCDFSGYSDMAIGVAKLFGFELGINFDKPYISRSPQEFWHRWHISLSEWLRDYVYIPLGGSRKKEGRTYINLLITMFIAGIWHGASWNFILWGVYHGCFLCLQRLYNKCSLLYKLRLRFRGLRLYNVFGLLATNIVVIIGWVLFRTQSIREFYAIISRMVMLSDGVEYIYSWSVILLLSSLVYRIVSMKKSVDVPFVSLKGFTGTFVYAVMFFMILLFGYFGSNAFIYFRF